MLIRTVGDAVAGRPLHDVTGDATVLQASELLETHNVGALAVMEAGEMIGILSERDIVRRAVARRKPPETTRVAEIMTPDPQTVGPETSLVIAMDLMLRGGFRHLPVIDDGKIYGMLSMRDVPGTYRLLHERFEAAFTELEEAAKLGVGQSVEVSPAR